MVLTKTNVKNKEKEWGQITGKHSKTSATDLHNSSFSRKGSCSSGCFNSLTKDLGGTV